MTSYSPIVLFGSTLKDTAGPDSDVDLLVEFERDAKPGLLDRQY
jgi:predicted nucleotidyltransferase